MRWHDRRTPWQLGVALVALTGLVGALGPESLPPAPPAQTTLRLITFSPALVLSVAQERGFFAAEGLDDCTALLLLPMEPMAGDWVLAR